MRGSVVERMPPSHAEGKDRPQAEASAQAEGEEGASHDQPFTGAAGAATGEPLTV
jgi:hypothetical protein